MDQMSKLNRYRQILCQVVEKHARPTPRPGQPESVPICDPVHDHFLLMSVGWDATGRAHYVIFHLRLKDGKVWVEWDGIEYGIARDLIEAGIPEEDIVMAYYGREPRPLTELMAA
jgi:hypothetical protein